MEKFFLILSMLVPSVLAQGSGFCPSILPTVINGRLEPPQGDTSIGSLRLVVCNNGYTMEEDSQRNLGVIECQPNGVWQKPGICAKGCPSALPHVENGRLEPSQGGATPFGSVRFVVCDKGYSAIDGNWLIQCLDDGTWEKPQKCVQASKGAKNCTSELPSVKNGRLEPPKGETSPGSIRQVLCDNGYTIDGNLVIECQRDGTWERPGICLKGADYQASSYQIETKLASVQSAEPNNSKIISTNQSTRGFDQGVASIIITIIITLSEI